MVNGEVLPQAPQTIRIDPEVWFTLQKRAVPLVETANDVLRRVLELPSRKEREVPSNKEVVYRLWEQGERNPTVLHQAVGGRVQLASVKSWLSGWRKGKNLPACAYAKAVVEQSGGQISCDQALKAAREDAETIYRNLERYWIRVALEEDGWHVDYELRDPRARGGGPHYVIDAANGRIRTKRYEQ